MRKNDLIKMLNEIEGNPEIVLWNNQVGDWMHIEKPKIFKFNRLKKSFKIDSINLERKFIDNLPELTEEEKKNIKNDEFVFGDGNRWNVLKTENFEHTNRIVLQGKSRGIKTFDRQGSIEY